MKGFWIMFTKMNVRMSVTLTACVIAAASVAYAQLTAYYDFNHQTNDTAVIDSVAGANATISQGGLYVTSSAGKNGVGFGNAAFFTGGNFAVLDNPQVFNFDRDDFTITGWIKVPNVGTCSTQPYAMVIEAGIHLTSGLNLWVGPCSKGNRGKLGIDVKGTATADNVTLICDARIDDNQWHWFAVMSEDQTLYMFIDGVEQFNSGFVPYGPTTAATVPAGTTVTYNMGKNLIAMVDDLKVYNTALTRTINTSTYTLESGELFDVWNALPPVGDCGDVIANGYGYNADINGDCKVNMTDFSFIATDWLLCNDPNETDCSKPWLN